MSQPFIGEIRMFAGNFAPAGWALCDGSLIPISENETLFVLIGTTYGGDGQETFALPDLRGRIPIHQGPGFILGQFGGVEGVTLTVNQIPAHSHFPQAQSGAGQASNPSNRVWASSSLNQFSASPPSASMDPGALSLTGGSQPHENMMPFLTVNFIIALFGIFPSQT
ncbi:MAG: tail fiber protein [Acidobacteriia bacterium]|nr:tail fiber protein [Terriglobia bacterium]